MAANDSLLTNKTKVSIHQIAITFSEDLQGCVAVMYLLVQGSVQSKPISLYFPDIKQQCRSLSVCSAHPGTSCIRRNLLSFITTNCLPDVTAQQEERNEDHELLVCF